MSDIAWAQLFIRMARRTGAGVGAWVLGELMASGHIHAGWVQLLAWAAIFVVMP